MTSFRNFYKLFFVGFVLAFIFLSVPSAYAAAPTWQSSAGASGKSTGTTIATPSGTQVGDLLILHIIYEKGTDTSVSHPAFTTIRTDNHSNKVGQRIAYRIHDGGSLGSFTTSPGGEWTYSISRVTGFNTSSPINTHNGANSASGSPNPPSITTSEIDTLVFIMVGSVKPSTYTPPSNYTERYERTNKFSNWGATRTLSSATTEDPGVATASEPAEWVAATVAINPTPNPTPQTSSIDPSSVDEGSSEFDMTVNGSNFVSGSVVRFDGSNRTTVFVSSTELTVTLPSSDLDTAGTFSITVFNPSPGGGTSNAQILTVNEVGGDNPTPSLSSISPTSKTVGDAQFTMTVNGSNFISDSVVRFDGSNRTTTFVSSSQLTATIPASDLDTAGTFDITVFNPSPGGGESGTKTFTVNEEGGGGGGEDNPVPSIGSISPTSVERGGSSFTLTVNGSSFVTDSVVRFEGANRTTTFVSSTQLTAQILAGDIDETGNFDITVFNPSPGGGESGVQTLSVVTSVSGGGGGGDTGGTPGSEIPRSIDFLGKAYPRATLTLLKRDESGAFPEEKIAVDLPVNSDGSFLLRLNDVGRARHKYALLATDVNGVSARSRFFEVDTRASILKTVEVDIPPTINLVRAVVPPGDARLIVNGYMWPRGKIMFEVDGKDRAGTIIYPDYGAYRIEISTLNLFLGAHNVRVRQTYETRGDIELSDYSLLKNFRVSTLITPDADLNGDGRIDISDWSIFLFRWSSDDQALRDTIDFNADGKLNLSDFSIFVRTLRK